ncbi:LysR family transcriptional regulator [Mycobacterium angelicum]|uniref:LysR family transcriptional regulator n=1 Tax=Mycobacterium angelicum TaxID=470074 RepID=A0A1W9ZFM4_MYCAN|nr:LysR family transcriptional regulator [Mycobacterium angelicum]MCV7198126.1 LysR family transcriptional regulator [Mycobacterium angelicum]ORA13650.1 LysR family transcriptional regulator [Mycobacterium angelicum]
MALSARMPDLSALEVLSAIAKTGSLSAASRAVGTSQQAVSARLTSIEAQVGVRLVTRTPRGTLLTPAGEVVAEWAEQVLDVAQRVDTGLASLRAERRSQLKVAASQTVAEHLLPRWLVSLQAAAQRRGAVAPEVTFDATDSEGAIAAVRDGRAELGFIETRAPLRGLRSRVIGRDELILVVPPDHKWVRRSAPITVAELRQTPLVSRKSGWRLLLGGDEPLDGDEPEPAAHPLEFASAAAVRAAVLAGAGPAVMSRLAVSDDLSHDRLRAVAVADLDLRRDLRAIWMGARTPPAGAARDLLNHIATSR